MRFTVIMVHHQDTTPHDEFMAAYWSIKDQTFTDFEFLIYHNGPFTQDHLMPPEIVCSEKNTGAWGIDNRNRGLQEAQGEYILFTNSDNLHYPNMLEEIDRCIRRPSTMQRVYEAMGPLDSSKIVVYPIILHDHQRVGGYQKRHPKGSGINMILTGNPPAPGNIDGMQFVMLRSLWLQHGGWNDRSPTCDGNLATRFCSMYGYRTVDKILGEHR